MSVFRCAGCRTHVQWMLTKFNKRMLFEHHLIPIASNVEGQGWIPGRWKIGTTTRMVLAPLAHYSRDKQARVQHVVWLHVCSAMAPAPRQESA